MAILSLTTHERRQGCGLRTEQSKAWQGDRDLKAWVSSPLPHPGHLWDTAWTHQHGASSGIEATRSTQGGGLKPAPIGLNAGGHQSLEATPIGRTKGVHPFSPGSPPKGHNSNVQEKGTR